MYVVYICACVMYVCIFICMLSVCCMYVRRLCMCACYVCYVFMHVLNLCDVLCLCYVGMLSMYLGMRVCPCCSVCMYVVHS